MSVSNYIKPCQYSLGKLQDYIYIIKDDAIIKHSIDDGSVNVQEISGEIYKLHGFNVMYSEEESLNNRFSFSSTLTINIREEFAQPYFELLDNLRQNKWKVIFINKENRQFINSVEFPSTLSYEYTYNSGDGLLNYNELTFKCNSNYPSMILNTNINDNDVEELVPYTCSYNIGGINNLRLINKDNIIVKLKDDYSYDELILLNDDDFSYIDFDKVSFNFSHKYDGNVFTDTISFTLPLSQYKFNFHYNLIEFLDNRYIAIFTSKLNKNNILSGEQFGYLPSFTIETSDDVATNDLILFTLTHKGDKPLIFNAIEVPPTPTDETLYVGLDFVKDPYGRQVLASECINDTQAKRLVLQESTINGQLLNKYWVLEGYESQFSYLNIVGTYTLEDDMGISLIFNSGICSSSSGCNILQGLPPSILFTQKDECKSYNILSECDWDISSIPSWLTIDITSGEANVLYNVTICNIVEPTESGISTNIFLNSGDNSKVITINVIKPNDWIFPINFNITAEAQYTYSFLYNVLQSDVSIIEYGGLNVRKSNGQIICDIPMNYSPFPIAYEVVVQNKTNGETRTITINQDKLYERWITVQGEYECDGSNSYTVEQKYIGYTSTDINIPTQQFRKGDLIQENDTRCTSGSFRWIDTNNFTCDGNNKYVVQMEQVSYDSGQTWTDTNNTRLGALVESNSDFCTNPPYPIQYQWIVRYDKYECSGGDNTRWSIVPINEDYICANNNKYYKEIEERLIDGVWTPTGQTRQGELYEQNSIDCGYVDYQYRWVANGSSYVCENGNKYQQTIRQRSADGVNWENVVPNEFGKGSLIELNSNDCIIKMEFTIKLTAFSFYSLPLETIGTTINVDWGDGVVEEITLVEENPAHQYPSLGTYTIKLWGDVRAISSSTLETWSMQALTKVNSWGNDSLNLTSMSYAFYQNTNLTSVPNDINLALKNVTNFSYMFYNCSKLSGSSPTYNGKKLWEAFPNANGTRCFYNCALLSDYDSIPSNWK